MELEFTIIFLTVSVKDAVCLNLANQFNCEESRKEIALNDECPVCMEKFDDSSRDDANVRGDITVLECRHAFYSECFENMQERRCPICRSNLGFSC